jgi:hypothetical protein
LIDERFWWSKKLSVGSRDPKRIQRRKRTTQNSQRQLKMLRPRKGKNSKFSKLSENGIMAKSALQYF